MKKIILFFTLLVLSMSVYALDKTTVKASLDQMRKSGMFTKEQIDAAEKQLMGMSEEDLRKLKAAGEKAAQDPKVRAKAQKLVDQMQKKSK